MVKSKFKPHKIIRSSVIKLFRDQDNIALGDSKINALTTLNPTLSITDNLQSVQAWYLSKLPLWKMYHCNIASMLYQRYVNPSKGFIPTAILLTGTHLWKVLPAHASFRLILGRYEDFNGIGPSYKKMSASVVDCIVCWFVNVLLKSDKKES